MDDFVLFHHDREYLKTCWMLIQKKLEEEYLLQLNPKTKIDVLFGHRALDFLGYRYYLNENGHLYLKIRTTTKKHFKRKVKKLYYLYLDGKIPFYHFQQTMNSYLGHFSYADTHYLIYNYLKRLYQFHDLGTEVRIDHNGQILMIV